MDWPAIWSESENQTTRSILIVGVIFNHFTNHNGIAKLLHAYMAENALIHSMLRELECPHGYLLADFLNQHSDRDRN